MPRASKTGVRGLRKQGDRYLIDLRWRDASTGERKRHTELLPPGTQLAAAKLRARTILNSAEAGTFDPHREKPKTLDEALDAYMEWCLANRPRSVKTKRSHVAAIKRCMASGTPVDRVSAFDLERFKRDRLRELTGKETWTADEQQQHAAAVNRAIGIIKHALASGDRKAWAPGTSDAKAAELRGVKLLPEPPGRVRCYSAEEEAKLVAELHEGVREIFLTSLLSGMRRAEVTLLKKEQVDLPHREIRLGRTKNGKARVVPINDTLAALLRPLMAAPGPYVFTSSLGQPYSLDTVTRAITRAAKRAGVEDARFHDTRHSYSTRLRRAGVPLDVLQLLGGWSNLSMVQRYAHVGQDELHAAVAHLDVASRLPEEQASASEKPNIIQFVGGK